MNCCQLKSFLEVEQLSWLASKERRCRDIIRLWMREDGGVVLDGL